MVVWMQAEYIGLAVCGDPASQKHWFPEHLPGPDRPSDSKAFPSESRISQIGVYGTHSLTLIAEANPLACWRFSALPSAPGPTRFVRLPLHQHVSATRSASLLKKRTLHLTVSGLGLSRNGRIVLGTVLGTVTQQSGAPAPGRACKLLQRMEATPGFEPGMEVLQKSDHFRPTGALSPVPRFSSCCALMVTVWLQCRV